MPEIDDSAKGYDLVGEADVLAEGKDPEWLDNREGRRGLRSAGDGCVVEFVLEGIGLQKKKIWAL